VVPVPLDIRADKKDDDHDEEEIRNDEPGPTVMVDLPMCKQDEIEKLFDQTAHDWYRRQMRQRKPFPIMDLLVCTHHHCVMCLLQAADAPCAVLLLFDLYCW